MSAVLAMVHLDEVRSKATGSEQYLGPARVLAVGASSTHNVSLEDGTEVHAEMALAFPYRPAPGDVLLVIGRRDRHYVIGVLAGNGEVDLRFKGDVKLRAVGGTLDLSSDRGVTVRGPSVELESQTLKVIAGAVTEKFETAYRRVRELLTVHAGESRTVVRGDCATQAKRASIVTEQTVRINGREIHLG